MPSSLLLRTLRLAGLFVAGVLLSGELDEGLAAQSDDRQSEDRPSFVIETGVINFGPVVTEEREFFVRFGSNDGMESYYAISFETNGHYIRLLLAPTQVHMWPTNETTIDMGEIKSANPRESRFHYRVRDPPVDTFTWASISGGWRFERSGATLRLGGGAVTLSQTSHQFWGARVGIAPMAEASLGARWRGLEASCSGQALGLGVGLGRWIVLEHAAGTAPRAGERRTRVVRPLLCGLSVRL